MTAYRLTARLLGPLSLILVIWRSLIHCEISSSSSEITSRVPPPHDNHRNESVVTQSEPSLQRHNNTITSYKQSHRTLLKLSDFLDPKSITTRDPSIQNENTARPYSLYNILQTLPKFRRELFILHYSSASNEFHVYINESKDGWVTALQNRIYQIMPMTAYALRNHFPDRFNGAESDDFILLASSGDEPKLDCSCVDKLTQDGCKKEEFAPILQFGAVFRDTSILPSLVTMPVWHHLSCLRQWQQRQMVCSTYVKRAEMAGVAVAAGQEKGSDGASKGRWGKKKQSALVSTPLEQVWESLIPQIVWRGSDFGFIWCVHPQLRLIDFEMDIAKRIALSQCRDNARGILQCLSQYWEILTPRWRAVFLTLEADLDAEETINNEQDTNGQATTTTTKPWIDARFTIKTHIHGHAVNAKKIHRYSPYEQYGLSVATPNFMSLADLSQYRYHFDIGGGGGTTFSGTIEKLAMPGVLFHHVTSTKDYYHDDLVPWMHYIPVEEGLSDLREMYNWAMENGEQAMRISEAASDYVKSWAEPSVMEEMYNKYFVEALGRVVDAYKASGDDVGEVLKERKWTLIAKGSGKDLNFVYTKEPSA